MDKIFVRLNNFWRSKVRKKKMPPENVLILFSHCLQNSECPQKIIRDLQLCKRCGKCTIKGLLELSERYGVKCVVASGGVMAMEKVKSGSVKGIVAIACEKELKEGIKGIFPKPVVAVPNLRPKGPCKDCQVELAEVERSIKSLLE